MDGKSRCAENNLSRCENVGDQHNESGKQECDQRQSAKRFIVGCAHGKITSHCNEQLSVQTSRNAPANLLAANLKKNKELERAELYIPSTAGQFASKMKRSVGQSVII